MSDGKPVEKTAEVIEFPFDESQRRNGKPKGTALVKAEEPNFIIPKLYRQRGCYFDLRASAKKGYPVASEDPAPPSYTLYNQATEYTQVANPAWDPIDRMDPKLDKGWVIIRRHVDLEAALGYLDAQTDLVTSSKFPPCSMFNTELGYFTVTHRKANRGAPDCLVVYIQKHPKLGRDERMDLMSESDQFVIRHADGSDTHDVKTLYPFLK